MELLAQAAQQTTEMMAQGAQQIQQVPVNQIQQMQPMMQGQVQGQMAQMAGQIAEQAPQSDFFHMFLHGGFFVYAIVGVSFIVSVLAIERFLALKFRYGIDGRRLFNEVKKFLNANDFVRALETCRQNSSAPLAQVLAAGLQSSGKSIEEMDTAMEAEALFHVPKIQERLGYIASLANIGLLMGLLGTISGLIKAFAAVGGAAAIGTGREAELAAGIGEAMLATAFGLGIAIPSLLLHQYLSNKAIKLIDEIQHYAAALKHLVLQIRNGSKPSSTNNFESQKMTATAKIREQVAEETGSGLLNPDPVRS